MAARCGVCGLVSEWPQPEVGCGSCGTVVRVPVHPVEPVGPGEPLGPLGPLGPADAPEAADGRASGSGDRGRGSGSGSGRDLPDAGFRSTDRRSPDSRAADSRAADFRAAANIPAEAPGAAAGSPPAVGSPSAADPLRATGPAGPYGPQQPEEAARPGGATQPGGAAPAPRAPRPAFRPMTIRTARDAVATAALYLRWLGFRDVRQPDGRPVPTAAVDLRAPGLVAQVDPTTAPAGLRAVECVWLNGLTVSATSVYFALAGYTQEARTRADELRIPLFVMDLTGAPQPLNDPADALVAAGA
ncbi:hypothetical protein ACFVGY_25010 [Streptomyces sp. NPDC127106]|uniref:hypothetical protein n=1 Tax=Streptomyces sp. NPDC127106 TaxID=3345360 RepID=UPI003632E556